MKTYLTDLTLPSDCDESGFIANVKETCFQSFYPYNIFPLKQLRHIEFAPITIFYGGNGSGKTTLLNIIAEKIGAARHSAFNSTPFFKPYLKDCKINVNGMLTNKQMLTSDDVFDKLLDFRYLNNGIDMKREELFEEYHKNKKSSYKLQSLDDYDYFKKICEAKSKSKSKYVKERLAQNIAVGSNGENALNYFVNRIDENGLYLLDEPENSLSIEYQLKFKDFLEDSARFFRCQFILATHSPVLLSLKNALIYDLDDCPVTTKKWTKLENMIKYFEFFESYKAEFYSENQLSF